MYALRFILYTLKKQINCRMLLKLFIFSNLFVASILNYCSFHRNAQYGLVPFRVLQLKIEDASVWLVCTQNQPVPLLAFSLHISSSSAFSLSFFKQSSHLSCGLPRFLQPSCFFVSDLFGTLLSFILTMCPANFIRLLTICQLYTI